MQITIHADSANGDDILGLLAKIAGTAVDVKPAAPEPAKPAKKASVKPAAPEPAKPAAPEPEPAAAEPAPEQPELPIDESSAGEGTLEEAVARASELVTAGRSDQVKKALAGTGSTRVSQLSGNDIAIFLAAL